MTSPHTRLMFRKRATGEDLAANCDVCAKGPSFGHSISHSHRAHQAALEPEHPAVRAFVAGTPKRLNVCTSCLKAGKVQRAV